MIKLVTSLLLSALLASLCSADQSRVFGDYQVKYSVISSEQLSGDLIRRFRLKREKNLGYVQIEVIPKKQQAGRLKITGERNNLVSRAKLTFREINLHSNPMYFAEFKYQNQDMCTFEINLQPSTQAAPYRLKFSRSLGVN